MISLFNPTVTNGSLDSVNLGGAATGIAGVYTITFNAVGTHSDTDSATATLTIEEPATVPAEVTASATNITAISATIDYNVTLNSDTSVSIQVVPTGETFPPYGNTQATVNGTGSFESTGLTASTTYDIIYASDLNTTNTVISSFTTIAAKDMNKSDLIKYAEHQGLNVGSKMTKAQILELL